MNLLTPVAGFLIGYSGVMGYEVLKSTHSGEMPGPKSFGYFIGAMTLLSAGTIYALGKKSNVLAAEDTTHALVTGSVEGEPAMFLFSKGESDDTGFTTGRILIDNDGEELRDIAANIHDGVGEDRIRKGFKSWKRNVWGLKPYSAEEFESPTDDWILSMKRLNPLSRHYIPPLSLNAEITDERFIEGIGCPVCGEHYDGTEILDMDEAIILHKRCAEADDYESESFNAELMVPDQCCICGIAFMGYGHNPEPYLPYAAGRCCDTCNATVVIPMRLRLMGFEAEGKWTRKARNRGLLRPRKGTKRISREGAMKGVRRNFWKDIFGVKNAEEFNAPDGVCLFCDETEELETINLDGWPEEICEECLDPANWSAESFNAEALARWDGKWKGIGWTREEEANLSEEEKEKIGEQIMNDWEAGKIEATDVDEYWERRSAEQTLKGRVRTISGKPHVPRKLKKDKDITAEEASKKLKFETPANAYNLAYNQGFDDGRSQKRVSRMVYTPDTAYVEDEKLFQDTFRRTK